MCVKNIAFVLGKFISNLTCSNHPTYLIQTVPHNLAYIWDDFYYNSIGEVQ